MIAVKFPKPYCTTRKEFNIVTYSRVGETRIYEAYDHKGGTIRLKIRHRISKAEAFIRDLLYSRAYLRRK